VTIFQFDDYKKYLKDHLRSLPSRGRGEINRIGAALRVHPTLVSQVLRGTKDFSADQALALGEYLGLRPLEAEYLLLLVQRERAGTAALRNFCGEKLSALKKQSLAVGKRLKEHRALSDEERAVFYSSWLYAGIRLYTSVGKGKTLEEISARFVLGRARTRAMLSFLTGAGLCQEEKGLYRLGTQHTHLDAQSPFLARHHASWRLRAIERSENLSDEELLFTSPFSVSKADFKKIREQIVELIQASSLVIRDSPAEEVACFNVDLFWLK